MVTVVAAAAPAVAVVIIISVVVIVAALRTASCIAPSGPGAGDALPDCGRVTLRVPGVVAHEIRVQDDDPQPALALLDCVIAACE